MTTEAPAPPVTDELLRSILEGPNEATWWVSAQGTGRYSADVLPRRQVRFSLDGRYATNADRFGWEIDRTLHLSMLVVWRAEHEGEPLARYVMPEIVPTIGHKLWIRENVVRIRRELLEG